MKKTLLTLAIVTLLVSPTLAQAPDEKWYVGAGVGQGQFKVAATGATVRIDDVGWTIFAGYQPLRFFSVELGFTNLGSATETDTGTGIEVDGEARAITAYGLGILPVTPHLDLYLKAGGAYWDTKATISGAISSSDSNDGTGFTYGIGMHYNISPSWSVRLEWVQFDFDEVKDVSFWDVGFRFRF